MYRRLLAVLFALPLALAALLVVVLYAELLGLAPKPRLYQGKTVWEWCQELRFGDSESQLRAAEAVAEAMKYEDGFVCTNAAKALYSHGPELAKAVLPDLIQALSNSDARARGEVIWLLYELGPEAKDAVPALTGVARADAEFYNRSNALALVGRLSPRTPETVALCRDILAQDNPKLREVAVEALAGQGPETEQAISLLLAALNDRDRTVRKAAARVLGESGPEANQTIPALKIRRPPGADATPKSQSK